ncbi:MAG: hypothetical protein ACKOCM_02915 [Cyanobacteriota bacterium]
MAAITLDKKGWSGSGRGRWTFFSDAVYATTTTENVAIETKPTTINTLTGSDSLVGTVTAGNGSGFGDPAAGVWVTTGTRLNLGLGDDQIIGEANVESGSYNFGVYNEGAIDTGYGNDLIQGSSRFGVCNNGSSTISMGDGSDQIIGESSDVNAAGQDFAVINHGFINMGAGKDSITGFNSTNGLFNDGKITMGDGADTVDALIGGAAGSPGGLQGGGLIDFGRGDDVLKGFGEGTFNSGAGTDSLVLQDGIYTVVANGSNFLITATNLALTPSPGTMTINSFEKIGGANDPLYSGFLDIAADTFKIENGNISLA